MTLDAGWRGYLGLRSECYKLCRGRGSRVCEGYSCDSGKSHAKLRLEDSHGYGVQVE